MLKYGKMSDAGMAKVKARKMINEAHKRFNARKRLIGDDKNLLPEKAYHNPADPNSLDPELKKSHYSGVHQPHPKFSPKHDVGRAKTGNYRLDEAGMPRITPDKRQVRDSTANNRLNTVALSTRHDDEHGERIEGREFHPKSDLEDQYVEQGLDDVFPHNALFGGVLHGNLSVTPKAGGKTWDRLTMNQELGYGMTYVPKHERLHTGGRETGYQMLRALATLHPRFWRKGRVPEDTIEVYNPLTGELVGGRLWVLKHYYGGLDKVSDDILRDVAATPIGELLTEEKRGDIGDMPNRPGRAEGGGLRRAVREMKGWQGLPTDKLRDIPKYDEWGDNRSPEYEAISQFNHNARQIKLEMGPSAEFADLFPKARVSLAEAMYLSILEKRRSGSKRPTPSAEVNLQDRFMAHFPSSRPINPNEIKDIPYHEGMERIIRPKPEESDLPRTGMAISPTTTPSETKPGLSPPVSTGPELGPAVTLDDPRFRRAEESDLAMNDAWLIIKGSRRNT